ncbi:MAG: hypothetical protein BGO01_16980 [Armatimonadetes bacterium 55-13]|nr:MAG: hypothetical protein BGO01_16980 [Armatimonadetes bacterium 55-13]
MGIQQKVKLPLLVALMALAMAGLGFRHAEAALHPSNVPVGRAKVQLDGTIDLNMRFDILAYLVDHSPNEGNDSAMLDLLELTDNELQARINDGQARFKRLLHLQGDNGPGVVESVVFPTPAEIHRISDAIGPNRIPVMGSVVIRGHLTSGAKSISMRFPDVLGTVILTTEFPYQEPYSEPVEVGAYSSVLKIPTAEQVAAIAKSIRQRTEASYQVKPSTPSQEKAVVKPVVAAEENKPEINSGRFGSRIGHSLGFEATPEAVEEPVVQAPATTKVEEPAVPSNVELPPVEVESQAPASSWYATFWSYIKMGFVHILPLGLDHILFVLGLFLLSNRTKDLLKQITAFTIAHSITLALSLYGIVRLPPAIVEPIIALSIVFVAVENIFSKKMTPWRPLVVFIFGLVHGMGFAGVLMEAGLARDSFLKALVGFNVGVELGQLTVVAGALLLVGWFRSNQKYRSFVTVPASIAIAAVALFWTFERIL